MSRESLGKGLDALFSSGPESTDRTTGITTLKIDSIIPNRYQPRKFFDVEKLAELAESMKVNGILQPVIVTKNADSQYELVAGERRLEAAKLADISEIPVIIRSITPQEQLQFAIIENIQREDLNAIEEAKAYQQLSEEFGLTHTQISEVVGKERTTVSNLIRLLKLDDKIQIMIMEGKITSGHARAILQVPPDNQQEFASLIYKKQMSVRMAEEYARKLVAKNGVEKPKKTLRSEDFTRIKSWEKQLHNEYSCRVNITKKNDKGRISFFFNSQQEMEKILESLKNSNE
ncbi:MAG: ParB/RepB/Spo0J family partition protein [Candidatus Cloacimonetes bacterium]|nr:ParB/RepB/Spo0J family partition protein [Candidatus Cloacimonadota bacterium]